MTSLSSISKVEFFRKKKTAEHSTDSSSQALKLKLKPEFNSTTTQRANQVTVLEASHNLANENIVLERALGTAEKFREATAGIINIRRGQQTTV